jgi:hypothetical protein
MATEKGITNRRSFNFTQATVADILGILALLIAIYAAVVAGHAAHHADAAYKKANDTASANSVQTGPNTPATSGSGAGANTYSQPAGNPLPNGSGQ